MQHQNAEGWYSPPRRGNRVWLQRCSSRKVRAGSGLSLGRAWRRRSDQCLCARHPARNDSRSAEVDGVRLSDGRIGHRLHVVSVVGELTHHSRCHVIQVVTMECPLTGVVRIHSERDPRRGGTSTVSRTAPAKRLPSIATTWKWCPCKCIGCAIMVVLRIVTSTRSPMIDRKAPPCLQPPAIASHVAGERHVEVLSALRSASGASARSRDSSPSSRHRPLPCAVDGQLRHCRALRP